tara:strand:- start:3932 stop:5056 length:1125 start_codon:yes stop_codon:yes gene_type:complete
MNSNLKKYLDFKSLHHYGKPSRILKNKKFDFFIVIPCYNEYNYIFKTLDSISKQNNIYLKNLLIVIVINNAKSSSTDVVENNSKTYNKIVETNYNLNLIAIDAFSKKFSVTDKKSGVGFARKVGLDHCLNYFKNLNSKLCFLDADTIIDSNYLDFIDDNYQKGIDAAVVNFKHQIPIDITLKKGINEYEKKLKKIAREIHNTGSPYGYVSMGSTITCNIKTYVSVGGMNIKKATEDFYFLQSIAKHTKIHQIKKCLVHPSARNENRVYLGTGFRMSEYKKNKKFNDLNYSKNSFKEIKKIITIANDNWKLNDDELLDILDDNLLKITFNFLNENKIKSKWNSFKKNSNDKKQFLIFFHQWFDALKIMKLLKYLN